MDRAAEVLKSHGEGLRAFCLRWNIAEFALFGSILRDDYRPASDIDVLVRFTEPHHWSVLDHLAMEAELSELLGRRVEMTSACRASVRRLACYGITLASVVNLVHQRQPRLLSTAP